MGVQHLNSLLRAHCPQAINRISLADLSGKKIAIDTSIYMYRFLEQGSLIDQLEVELDERGNIKRDENFQSTQEGIFVAGDAGRGQSLIVWAIAEGRSAASAVDRYLTGNTQLPAPIEPTSRPLTV